MKILLKEGKQSLSCSKKSICYVAYKGNCGVVDLVGEFFSHRENIFVLPGKRAGDVRPGIYLHAQE